MPVPAWYHQLKEWDQACMTGDIKTLFKGGDLAELGRLAEAEKRRRFGDRVFWVRNFHLNYTNICRSECKVCRYSRRKGEDGGYALAIDEIVARASGAVAQGAAEIHIVGGVNPDLPFSFYVEMIRQVRRLSRTLFIKAFTASEIDHMCTISDKQPSAVLGELIEAGLNSMPGGGAEIFSARVRKELFPDKLSAERWLEIHQTAHGLGLRTTATMLFGHIETLDERMEHLLAIKRLQERTRGFSAFVPLPVVGFGGLEGVDGLDSLRTLAVSRLVLDNIDHIKVFWPIWGTKLAQLGLSYGADDIDGTVGDYKVVDRKGMPVSAIKELIEQAGFVATERDGRYIQKVS